MLSGFVCIFHPAAPGSSPKHTIYAFSNLFMNCVVWKDENKQKEAEIGPFFIKTNIQMKEMWIKRGRSKLKSDKLQFRQNKKNGLFL